MLEPLLYLLGYGKFSLKISPFCGFVNVVVNDENNNSVPLNRLLDLGLLYQKLIPLLPRMRANKYDISLPLANSLRKVSIISFICSNIYLIGFFSRSLKLVVEKVQSLMLLAKF